jgi:acyl-CoA synthetase (AMP-forming)/AMP-acid ligase II
MFTSSTTKSTIITPTTTSMELFNLYLLLQTIAEKYPEAYILFYEPGCINKNDTKLKYSELLKLSKQNAEFIHQFELQPESIILLHFNNHFDNVVWFWSVVCAGFIPAMSTPFTNNDEQRRKHILHLHSVLKDPICLTRDALLPEFASQNLLKTHTIDSVPITSYDFSEFTVRHGLFFPLAQGVFKQASSLAVLMLTSGSTGNAKAVCLTHGQILRSISGKSKTHRSTGQMPFLNWIGFDHVACLTEIHLHAMWVGAS